MSRIMNFMQLFLLVAVLIAGANTTSALFGSAEENIRASLISLGELLLMPSLDTSSFDYSKSPRCGQAPLFPVGSKTLVKVHTRKGVRQFLLYVPTSFAQNNSRKAAVHILFHGLGDNCNGYMNSTGFIPHAEREGYILASACGTLGTLGIGWNAGTCCGFGKTGGPDDVEFAEKIVRTVAAGACVDLTKVMASGFSNGAMLSQVLGCTKPEIFRVIVSVSGILEMRPGNKQGLQECGRAIRANNNQGIRPNVLIVHGDFDIFVPVIGNPILGFPKLIDNIETWKSLNGCTGDGQVTINTTKYRNRVYTSCQSANDGLRLGIQTYTNHSTNAAVPRAADVSEVDRRRTTLETVFASRGGHNWFEDHEFSTTNYVNAFGKRVFGGY